VQSRTYIILSLTSRENSHGDPKPSPFGIANYTSPFGLCPQDLTFWSVQRILRNFSWESQSESAEKVPFRPLQKGNFKEPEYIK
jgi:hypothetical protein